MVVLGVGPVTPEHFAAAASTETLRLRVATVADVPTLERWDRAPHVIVGVTDDPAAQTAFEGIDWREEIEASSPVSFYLIAEALIEGSSSPIGAMQVADPSLEPSHYWGDVEENLRVVDIWIGEVDAVNRGWGARMMRQVVAACFAEPDVRAILIDPLASNVAAQRFYERLGFVPGRAPRLRRSRLPRASPHATGVSSSHEKLVRLPRSAAWEIPVIASELAVRSHELVSNTPTVVRRESSSRLPGVRRARRHRAWRSRHCDRRPRERPHRQRSRPASAPAALAPVCSCPPVVVSCVAAPPPSPPETPSSAPSAAPAPRAPAVKPAPYRGFGAASPPLRPMTRRGSEGHLAHAGASGMNPGHEAVVLRRQRSPALHAVGRSTPGRRAGVRGVRLQS